MRMAIKSVGVTLVVVAVMGGCGGTSNIGSGEGVGQDPLKSLDPACDGLDASPACENPYGPFATVTYCVNDPVRPAGKNCPGFGILEQGATCNLMSGMCTIDCSADTDCPEAGSGTAQAVCGQVTPDSSPLTCLLPCDSGQTCPDGMACKEVESFRKICLFEMPCLNALPPEWGTANASSPCVAGDY